MNPNSALILGSDLCVLPHSYSRKVNQTAAVLTAAPHVTAGNISSGVTVNMNICIHRFFTCTSLNVRLFIRNL